MGMIRTQRRLRLCAVWLILNLLFIWGNSLLPGSVSGAISMFVKDLLSALFPNRVPGGEAGHGLLRKLAHFTEFCSLGICLSWLFGMLGKSRFRLTAFACGAAAACVDETIQCFVPDRGPGLKDVAIDNAGVLAGIILLSLGYYFTHKKLEETT